MQNTVTTKDQPLEAEEIQARLALILNRFDAAQKKRANWESLWEECYNYALPQRGGFTSQPMA
ncbi:MAG: hypothetical protein KDI11_07475, partial [Alphaproteobacteria bacterium]|nr:hypothetical protein [Alphaproteobacteria bacterium]